MKRILCHLFGCKFNEDGVCDRCGADYYGGRELHHGIWERAVTGPLHRLRRYLWPRCNQCGRSLLGRERHKSGDFCSESCFQEWMPF